MTRNRVERAETLREQVARLGALAGICEGQCVAQPRELARGYPPGRRPPEASLATDLQEDLTLAAERRIERAEPENGVFGVALGLDDDGRNPTVAGDEDHVGRLDRRADNPEDWHTLLVEPLARVVTFRNSEPLAQKVDFREGRRSGPLAGQEEHEPRQPHQPRQPEDGPWGDGRRDHGNCALSAHRSGSRSQTHGIPSLH